MKNNRDRSSGRRGMRAIKLIRDINQGFKGIKSKFLR